MIKQVRIHTCSPRKEGYVVEKCRCRKYVSEEKAAQLLADGVAGNVILSWKIIQVEARCPMCDGSGMKKSCRVCDGSGIIIQDKEVDELGPDIYMRPVLRTPRTATIEAEHIEYAYVKLDRDAAKRIELYNELTQLMLVGMGAELRNHKTGEIVIQGTPEPSDDPKTGQGRNIDYGRAI